MVLCPKCFYHGYITDLTVFLKLNIADLHAHASPITFACSSTSSMAVAC